MGKPSRPLSNKAKAALEKAKTKPPQALRPGETSPANQKTQSMTLPDMLEKLALEHPEGEPEYYILSWEAVQFLRNQFAGMPASAAAPFTAILQGYTIGCPEEQNTEIDARFKKRDAIMKKFEEQMKAV